jgi:hypothetical protein
MLDVDKAYVTGAVPKADVNVYENVWPTTAAGSSDVELI